MRTSVSSTRIGGAPSLYRSVQFFVVYVLLHTLSLHVGSALAHSGQPEAQDQFKEEVITAKFAPPKPTLEFVSYLLPHLEDFRTVAITEGTRINVDWKGGNWTTPDGELLADVLPGVGAEHGYIDAEGILHVSGRYTVQFVSDKKYGFVTMNGFGTAGVSNEVSVVVETDSAQHRHLNSKPLYGPGIFSPDGYIVSPYWSFDNRAHDHDHDNQYGHTTTTNKKSTTSEKGYVASWIFRTFRRVWSFDQQVSSTADL